MKRAMILGIVILAIIVLSLIIVPHRINQIDDYPQRKEIERIRIQRYSNNEYILVDEITEEKALDEFHEGLGKQEIKASSGEYSDFLASNNSYRVEFFVKNQESFICLIYENKILVKHGVNHIIFKCDNINSLLEASIQ